MSLPRPVLQLVNDSTNGAAEFALLAPAERVFAHWVFMLGKHPRRVAMGPARRKVIERALALYDEDVLLMAIEGNAASAWHAGDNDRGQAFNDLELILRNEAQIERFSALGEALRERALRAAAAEQAAADVVPIAPADPAAVQAARERLRQVAARTAGRKGALHG